MKDPEQNRLAAFQGMQKGSITKYRRYPPLDLPNRQWPSRMITQAPRWCSIDLRDGNQALPIPMSIAARLEMFNLLRKIGFKEIEVGFPGASQADFVFLRQLIDENLIPDDVTIQMLTAASEKLIRRTVEALRGAKNVIFHLYNEISEQQRRIVTGVSKAGMLAIVDKGTHLVKALASELTGTSLVFQYSLGSFPMSEMDFALEVCETVMNAWQPTPEHRMILNLPETVQVSTPNVYADQVEWISTHLSRRDSAIIGLHTHNDRGTGVASTEQGLLAGGERVEGTLFGNGERTGNLDIITVALNMYMQGIDPGLDFSNLDAIRDVYERCTHLTVSERHPYGGKLVFTALARTHQDAIQKGMHLRKTSENTLWDVPYLPIDPQDIGRTYEAISPTDLL